MTVIEQRGYKWSSFAGNPSPRTVSLEVLRYADLVVDPNLCIDLTSPVYIYNKSRTDMIITNARPRNKKVFFRVPDDLVPHLNKLIENPEFSRIMFILKDNQQHLGILLNNGAILYWKI